MKQNIVKLLFVVLTVIAANSPVSAETLKVSDGLSTVSVNEGLINLNKATIEQLMSLPGIGESKAQAIVDYRESQGPFKAIDELVNVKGIGEKLMSKIAGSVAVQ